MNTHADKTQENKSQSLANAATQKQSGSESTFQFVDNRPEAVTQRKLQEMANSHSAQRQQPIQKKENNTGLPDNLKAGIENLSGYSMDDVKVHRNSDKPAQLNAHAYAQGTDIHLASGQEKHLPHEAWHVVQQKQGRVKPTMQMKGKVNVNDDAGLEKEADVMGAKALQKVSKNHNLGQLENQNVDYRLIQKKQTIQLRLSDEDLQSYYNEKLYQGKTLGDILEENEGYLDDEEKEQLGLYFSARDKDGERSNRIDEAIDSIDKSTKMSRWEYDGKTYHLNLTTETYHITEEGNPKKHYFFEGTGADIEPTQCTPEERGRNSKESKFTFNSLPEEVQDFVKAYWYDL